MTGNNQCKDSRMKPPLPRTLSAVPQTLHARLEIAKAIRALAGPDEDELLQQRRTEIAAIRRDLEVLSCDLPKAFEAAATLAKAELRAALKKYSADQPRVPAGNPDGGQWSTGDGGSGLPSSSSGAASDEPEHRTQYAARDTGTLTDETKVAPANSSAHDDSAEVHVAQATDWQNLPVNLVEEEAPNGVGHAIARHVAKSDAELKAEFPEDSYYGWTQDVIPKREGSFDSIENANDLVNRTLRANGDKVDLVVSGKLDFAFMETRFGFVTGYEVYRPDPYDNEFVARKTYGVGVFIWRDPHSPRGFRVRTAYPMNFD
jgi:Bacterial CdiA-CT RNAse A domain